ATVDATAYQTLAVGTAVETDTGQQLQRLNADGGMSVNSQLMQCQADILEVDLYRSADIETTARGAADAAGRGLGVGGCTDQLRQLWQSGGHWSASIDTATRQRLVTGWHAAIEHAIGWPVDETG